MEVVAEPDLAQDCLSPVAPLRRRDLLEKHHELDVLQRGEHGHEIVRLEDEPDPVAPDIGQARLRQVGELPVFDGDDSLVGCIEASDEVQQRRLAGAGRTSDRGEFALLDRQIQASERVRLDAFPRDVGLVNTLYVDDSHC